MSSSPREIPIFHHLPVLLSEVVEALRPQPGKLFVDGTLGGGGHTRALLQAGASVLGLDQDEDALDHTVEQLAEYEDHFCALHSNFEHLRQIIQEAGVSGFDGILVDLGVSSFQLDHAERGFSFQKDGPLDLRMDASRGLSAAEWLRAHTAEEIEQCLREYGEEPRARQIAQGIVRELAQRPLNRTLELADLVRRFYPGYSRRHPATRTFQALRIAVNNELGVLETFLRIAPHCLKPGGRLAIITFHSLEDRMVKRAFQHLSSAWLDRPEWPQPRPNPEHLLRLVTRKAITASEQEILRNPRARSAQLRVAERIDDHAPTP